MNLVLLRTIFTASTHTHVRARMHNAMLFLVVLFIWLLNAFMRHLPWQNGVGLKSCVLLSIKLKCNRPSIFQFWFGKTAQSQKNSELNLNVLDGNLLVLAAAHIRDSQTNLIIRFHRLDCCDVHRREW